jgi:hypothetical protein
MDELLGGKRDKFVIDDLMDRIDTVGPILTGR